MTRENVSRTSLSKGLADILIVNAQTGLCTCWQLTSTIICFPISSARAHTNTHDHNSFTHTFICSFTDAKFSMYSAINSIWPEVCDFTWPPQATRVEIRLNMANIWDVQAPPGTVSLGQGSLRVGLCRRFYPFTVLHTALQPTAGLLLEL